MKTLGIDISKDTLDLCINLDEAYYQRVNNDENGFFTILQTFHNFKIDTIGFESTGTYGKKLEKYLFDNGLKPIIIKPIVINNFRKTLKIQSKNDKNDSFAISEYLKKHDVTEYLSYPTRELFKPLNTSILLLEKQVRQTKNLIHSLENYAHTDKIIKQLLETSNFTELQHEKIYKETLKLFHIHCPEARLIKQDIKGVGDKLLLFLIPMIYDHFDKYTIKQISAFFGLNPVQYRSGSSVYKKDRLSKQGDKSVMKFLYMASISSVRNNEILKEKYLRLKENGKHTKVALMAVMSHLLRAIVYHLSRHTKRPLKK